MLSFEVFAEPRFVCEKIIKGDCNKSTFPNSDILNWLRSAVQWLAKRNANGSNGWNGARNATTAASNTLAIPLGRMPAVRSAVRAVDREQFLNTAYPVACQNDISMRPARFKIPRLRGSDRLKAELQTDFGKQPDKHVLNNQKQSACSYDRSATMRIKWNSQQSGFFS